jgi:hypothetical protein
MLLFREAPARYDGPSTSRAPPPPPPPAGHRSEVVDVDAPSPLHDAHNQMPRYDEPRLMPMVHPDRAAFVPAVHPSRFGLVQPAQGEYMRNGRTPSPPMPRSRQAPSVASGVNQWPARPARPPVPDRSPAHPVTRAPPTSTTKTPLAKVAPDPDFVAFGDLSADEDGEIEVVGSSTDEGEEAAVGGLKHGEPIVLSSDED